MRRPTPAVVKQAIINMYVKFRKAGHKMLHFESKVRERCGVCKTVAYEVVRQAKLDGRIKTE